MRKMILALFIILCLLFISSLRYYKISVNASPKMLYVPDDYTKIQWAIDNATDGDIIFVHNGTYYENIVINKSITLMGENKNLTIINGNGTGNVVTIKADNIRVQNFTIMNSGSGAQYSGILIEPPSKGDVITNNIIKENFYGIYIYSSSHNFIYDNIISGNAYGIGFNLCSNNFIFSNFIGSNINDGIYLLASFSNFISYNTILSNRFSGISLQNSENNIVYGNTISTNSFYGIFLFSSSYNVISYNTIISNPYGGMITLFSNNNTIYHNNLNNPVQVYSSDSTNFWSFSGEGNYWSNYNGTDFYKGPNQDHLGSDGIGDVPYIIDKTNVDKSPLMGMFYPFDVTYKQKTYQVTLISNSTICDFQFKIGLETGNRIILFKPEGNESTVGFCRVMIPTEFMSYPYILLLGNEEITPSFLEISNETHVYLYFTYLHKNQTVTIISSELLNIYYNLNVTYYNLLNLYNELLYNYTYLERSFEQLNASYNYFYDLNLTFYNFLGDYARLQEDFHYLNETYYTLAHFYGRLQMDFDDLNFTYYNFLDIFALLLNNYTQLQEDYQKLNTSYQDHLRSYSENVNAVKSLTYILAAGAAILIIVTTYLSKRAHGSIEAYRIKRFGEE